MSDEKLYQSRLLRVHEYEVFAAARSRVGKQNYMKVAPEKLYQFLMDLDKASIEVRHWQDLYQAAVNELKILRAMLSDCVRLLQIVGVDSIPGDILAMIASHPGRDHDEPA